MDTTKLIANGAIAQVWPADPSFSWLFSKLERKLCNHKAKNEHTQIVRYIFHRVDVQPDAVTTSTDIC